MGECACGMHVVAYACVSVCLMKWVIGCRMSVTGTILMCEYVNVIPSQWYELVLDVLE